MVHPCPIINPSEFKPTKRKKKQMQTSKPDNYQKYRDEGFTQSQAFKMNMQDVIDWAASNGHVETTWSTKIKSAQ